MALKKKNRGYQIVANIVMIFWTLFIVLPFVLLFMSSITDESYLLTEGYGFIPKKLSLDAYAYIFKSGTLILNAYAHTIFYTVVGTIVNVAITALFAYPLSLKNLPGKRFWNFYVFFTMLFSAGLVPSYIVNTRVLHLKNTIWIYIFPGLISAWNLIVIRTNYKSLPNELIESAKLDGASELQICFKIVMPLSKATLATVGFLFLVGKWNDWSTSSIYIRNPDLFSLQYLLQKILREAQMLKQMAATDPSMMQDGLMPTESLRYAMALVAGGPMLVVFPFFQKYFAKGMTIGAVKG